MSLTDPELNTTTWTLDALNRVVEEENELADSRYFVYDAASNLVQRTDRNGRVIAWQYDGLHRRVAEQWLSSGDPPTGLSVDTTTAGLSVDEVQLVGFGDSLGLTGGTFTLTFGGYTTGALAYNASAGTVEAALEGLTSIGSGNVSVAKTENTSTAQEWEITFTGALAGANQSQTTIDTGNVTSDGTLVPDATTDTEGVSTNEVQLVTLENAYSGTFTLTFDSETTDPLDFDADASAVEDALEALASIGSGNVSVSGSAGGPGPLPFKAH